MNQIFSYDKWAYQLLKQCSNKKDLNEWNEYRKQHNNAYVNLKFSNLENFYLVDANLENVDLRGATLDFANMKNTNIKKTNISKNILWFYEIAYVVILSVLMAVFIDFLNSPKGMTLYVGLLILLTSITYIISNYIPRLTISLIIFILCATLTNNNIYMWVLALIASMFIGYSGYIQQQLNKEALNNANVQDNTKIRFSQKRIHKPFIHIQQKIKTSLRLFRAVIIEVVLWLNSNFLYLIVYGFFIYTIYLWFTDKELLDDYIKIFVNIILPYITDIIKNYFVFILLFISFVVIKNTDKNILDYGKVKLKSSQKQINNSLIYLQEIILNNTRRVIFGIVYVFSLIEKLIRWINRNWFNIIIYLFFISMIYLFFTNQELFINYMKTTISYVTDIVKNYFVFILLFLSFLVIRKTDIIIWDSFKKILNYERINIFYNQYDKEIDKKDEEIEQADTNDERQRLISEKLKIKELNKKLSHLLKILQKPYEHLADDIFRLQILNSIYYVIIILISGSFIYYLYDYLIDERKDTFNKLFEIKDKLPDFGAIFGITIFYGTTIIFTLYIITYLIRQINQNRNLIDKYQIQLRKIQEIVSIIEAKTWIKDFKNFEEITSKFLDKLEENVMTNKECPATSEEKNEDEEAKILNGIKERVDDYIKTWNKPKEEKS